MIFASFGGLGWSLRAILATMLGDVGCKTGPRWIQEAFESDFFVQLGVLMGILAPKWQDKPLQDGSRGLRGGLAGQAGGGGVVQQGGGI